VPKEITMSGRERQDPDDRFAGDEHLFDLAASARDLREEEQEPRRGHRQVTLLHEEGLTVILFAFDAGGRLARHSAEGLVLIHVVAGAIDVTTAAERRSLTAGSLLVLAAGVEHDVTAREPSEMLQTVHRRHG
jgi:quercetin dioxygenase-like cupin family protein